MSNPADLETPILRITKADLDEEIENTKHTLNIACDKLLSLPCHFCSKTLSEFRYTMAYIYVDDVYISTCMCDHVYHLSCFKLLTTERFMQHSVWDVERAFTCLYCEKKNSRMIPTNRLVILRMCWITFVPVFWCYVVGLIFIMFVLIFSTDLGVDFVVYERIFTFCFLCVLEVVVFLICCIPGLKRRVNKWIIYHALFF